MAAKILIVEDDLNLLSTLKYNFLKEGCEVITAVDGAGALETARREKLELIVLDVMLPKLNGFEVCRILRKETNVPILMLTAKVDEVDNLDFTWRICKRAFEYGVDSFSTPQILAFAFELYEAGILTDKDFEGCPSDKEGRFFWLLDRLARREGIGDVLADGTYHAARRIGKGAEAFDHNTTKKHEQQSSGLCNFQTRTSSSRHSITLLDQTRLTAFSSTA